MQLRSVPTPPGQERPNYASLTRHYNRFGLDNAHTGHRKTAQTYTNYKTFAKDALVEVAFDYLTADEYTRLIDHIGYGQYINPALADWRTARGLV